MYFKDFPKFQYDFAYGNTTKVSVVQDITRNIRFRRDVLSNISLYDEYDIIDGETPEIIAEKYYGNPEYHWIIMLANDRHDYITDFPLPEYTLEKYIVDKYGDQRYAVHHYINANGFVVNSDAVGATSVSNDDYERDLNESKRRIKLISPDLISNILKQYKELL
jgi:hypothetical protein